MTGARVRAFLDRALGRADRPAIGPTVYPRVIRGKEGWRFLGDGTNFSLSQMLGQVEPSHEARHGWTTALRTRQQRYGDRTATFIVPEKTKLYRNHLPDGLAVKMEGFAVWLSHAGLATYLFAEHLDAGDAGDLYHRADTHTTAVGSFVAVRAMLARLGFDVSVFQPHWIEVPAKGLDLLEDGESLDGHTWPAVANLPPWEIATNGIANRGCVTAYRNAAAPRAKILLFGDSYAGLYFAPAMACFVSDVLFVHQAAFDYEMIERVRPDAIIGEIAERFLMQPPSEGCPLTAVIEEKLADGRITPEEARMILATSSDFAVVYGPTFDLTEPRLEARLLGSG